MATKDKECTTNNRDFAVLAPKKGKKHRQPGANENQPAGHHPFLMVYVCSPHFVQTKLNAVSTYTGYIKTYLEFGSRISDNSKGFPYLQRVSSACVAWSSYMRYHGMNGGRVWSLNGHPSLIRTRAMVQNWTIMCHEVKSHHF